MLDGDGIKQLKKGRCNFFSRMELFNMVSRLEGLEAKIRTY